MEVEAVGRVEDAVPQRVASERLSFKGKDQNSTDLFNPEAQTMAPSPRDERLEKSSEKDRPDAEGTALEV